MNGAWPDGFLSAKDYAWVRRNMPVACVDVLPFRGGCDTAEVLLIRRSERERRDGWALIGGRICLGESVEAAAGRHVRASLGEAIEVVPRDWTAPEAIGEYPFAETAPPGSLFDPEQHSIALNYLVEIRGVISARDEALDAGWFAAGALPKSSEFVFGQHGLVSRLASDLSGSQYAP